jgi:hypothetical protein
LSQDTLYTRYEKSSFSVGIFLWSPCLY